MRGCAGDVGRGDVGSNSGDSLPASWVWWLGGDRLLAERAEVAVTGDGGENRSTLLRGDVGSKSSCSEVLMGAWCGRGDRLLSDSPESVELAAEGDTEPASLCGVRCECQFHLDINEPLGEAVRQYGGCNARERHRAGFIILVTVSPRRRTTLAVQRSIVRGCSNAPVGPIGEAPPEARVAAVDASDEAASPAGSGHEKVAEAA